MKKLSFLVGTWKGPATAYLQTGPVQLEQTKQVLVEGNKGAWSGDETVKGTETNDLGIQKRKFVTVLLPRTGEVLLRRRRDVPGREAA
jgi:hypothetical protein